MLKLGILALQILYKQQRTKPQQPHGLRTRRHGLSFTWRYRNRHTAIKWLTRYLWPQEKIQRRNYSSGFRYGRFFPFSGPPASSVVCSRPRCKPAGQSPQALLPDFNPKSHKYCCRQDLLIRRCPYASRTEYFPLKGRMQGAGRGKEACISSGGSWPKVEKVGTPAQSPPASPPGSPARLDTAVAGCTAVATREKEKAGGLQVRKSRRLHSSQGQPVMLRERKAVGTTLLTLVSAWQPGCPPRTFYQH